MIRRSTLIAVTTAAVSLFGLAGLSAPADAAGLSAPAGAAPAGALHAAPDLRRISEVDRPGLRLGPAGVDNRAVLADASPSFVVCVLSGRPRSAEQRTSQQWRQSYDDPGFWAAQVGDPGRGTG